MKEKIAFIINPISGIGKQKEIESDISKYLDLSLFEPHIFYTEYPRHAKSLAKEIIAAGFSSLVAVGGDGSINECAQSVIDTNIYFGIIPTGSGNGLARFLNIPLNTKGAIDVINQRHTMRIDTVRLNDISYISIAGIGFDALVADGFAHASTRGLATYLRVSITNYPLYSPFEYTLLVDGREIKSKALFISFANSDQFGYNTRIAPKAKINDGLMDICLIQKVPIPLLPIAAHLLFSRQIDKSIFVDCLQAKEVHVQNDPSGLVNIDGEAMYLGKDLHFRINPLSLNVIVPKEYEK